ncbi:xanthine dehydrogenase family protein molybdopterin-binding subunit [Pseudobacteriovorax antillogorgiicola]|uniref:Isoquinoline 1-oxidoreductase, beta subunit n=1 Tax=Pseudobacteriovorax antillogorgiicola TaxID=1513793 RepID=A0A1Y6C925_9BACT|nr:molybdopterin cofactor-binding domain-containing protein [Pseudobacteriovorax antillogorgiicola]TCS49782.1 isoquinoline 1-oxidoreductase beta subunit [Pseudobacteriovorax antillogorgiicola]SMF42835.1 isoquinoline 1-oxidoreductase, beta subunit [Pseudobacteriovorax antillogorgiicola]
MSLVIKNMSRRGFVQTSAGVAGFVLTTQAEGTATKIMAAMAAADPNKEFSPNVFLSVPSKGPIEIVCHRSEMGQGIRNGIPMLIAEELEVNLDDVKIIQATGDKKYGDQNTDGSRSIRFNWDRLRTFGATARTMLETAAAQTWKVKASECYAKEGKVYHKSSGKSLSYQELALVAAKLPVPKDVELKKPKDYKLIGKKSLSVDRKALSTGQATYGMDVERPGMVYAALNRSPTIGGSIKSFDAKDAKKQTGVMDVVTLDAIPQPINTNAAVAVIASNSWAAMQGASKVKVQWQDGPYGKLDTEAYMKKLKKAGEPSKLKVAQTEGKKPSAKPAYTVSQEFSAPFLVHAPMEPLVATAAPTKDGGMEIWAPIQDPQRLRASAAGYLKIPEEKVTVHVTFLGGGFGRKSQPDFGLEAVSLAQKLKKPVKVVWSREDEIKHGFYHAASWQKLSADLDKDGNLLSWNHDTVFPTVMTVFQAGVEKPHEFELGMGATNMPYRAGVATVRHGMVDAPVRVAWLRAVCNVFHATAINGFVDELARKVDKDPIDYRLQLIGKSRKLGHQDTGRLRAVIERCRDVSNWASRKKKGAKLGFASHYSFQSYVAVVVEVEKDSSGVRVKQVDMVADVGQVVHPEAVVSQFQGAAVFGLSAALYGDIQVKNGAVVQNNYHDYPVMRIDRSPKINVDLVENNFPPEGVGEPGTPPVVPAVIAAIRELTGDLITELPVSKHMNA